MKTDFDPRKWGLSFSASNRSIFTLQYSSVLGMCSNMFLETYTSHRFFTQVVSWSIGFGILCWVGVKVSGWQQLSTTCYTSGTFDASELLHRGMYKNPCKVGRIFTSNLNWCRISSNSHHVDIGQKQGTLFAALMQQEIGFFDTTQIGELTSRMTQDCQQVVDQAYLNVNLGRHEKRVWEFIISLNFFGSGYIHHQPKLFNHASQNNTSLTT